MSNHPLRAFRERKGISLRDFSALVGVQHAAVWKWECGRQPSGASAMEIERATKGEVTRSQLRPDLWSEEPIRNGAAA